MINQQERYIHKSVFELATDKFLKADVDLWAPLG